MDSASNKQANKQLMQEIFSELAKGNGQPFVDSFSEDFCWIITGGSAWSGTYRGKEVVRRELLEPLFAQFAGRYTNTAERLIAEDDYVVVQCRGQVMTKAGKRYDNSYCYVCRFAGGKLCELTEYLDTQLVNDVLTAPAAQAAA